MAAMCSAVCPSSPLAFTLALSLSSSCTQDTAEERQILGRANAMRAHTNRSVISMFMEGNTQKSRIFKESHLGGLDVAEQHGGVQGGHAALRLGLLVAPVLDDQRLDHLQLQTHPPEQDVHIMREWVRNCRSRRCVGSLGTTYKQG